MTISYLRSMFYTWVIGQLKNVLDESGRQVADSFQHNTFRLYLGWQPRDRDFAHNYERNKFLRHRDKYIYASIENTGRSIHLLTEHRRNNVVVYQKNMQAVFGEDSEKAIKVLVALLHKFYDKVDIAERSTLENYDISNNRYQEMERFHEIL